MQVGLERYNKILASGVLQGRIAIISIEHESTELYKLIVEQMREGVQAGQNICIAMRSEDIPRGLEMYLTCYGELVNGVNSSFACIPRDAVSTVQHASDALNPRISLGLVNGEPNHPVELALHDVDIAMASGMPSFY